MKAIGPGNKVVIEEQMPDSIVKKRPALFLALVLNLTNELPGLQMQLNNSFGTLIFSSKNKKYFENLSFVEVILIHTSLQMDKNKKKASDKQ